jgi:hypothetical protein
MEILKEGDEIVFTVGDSEYPYKVCDNHLNYLGSGSNYIIFEELGLSEETKIQMANKYYGYAPHGGDWPCFIENDYKSATELVKRLYDLCNIYNSKEK